jgi:CHAT domain-containing protein
MESLTSGLLTVIATAFSTGMSACPSALLRLGLTIVALGALPAAGGRPLILAQSSGDELEASQVLKEIARGASEVASLKNAGRSAEAVKKLEYLTALARSRLGVADPVHYELLETLGGAYVEVSRPREAAIAFEEAVAARSQALGADDPKKHHLMLAASIAYARAGEHEKSVGVANLVVEAERSIGAPSLVFRRGLQGLMSGYTALGRYEGAYRAAKELLREQLREPADDPQEIAETRRVGAYLAEATGRNQEAIALFKEAVDQAERRKEGPETVLPLLDGVTLAYIKAGMFEEAIPTARQAVALSRERPVDPAQQVDRLLMLSTCELSTDDLAAAEASLSIALELVAPTEDAPGAPEQDLQRLANVLGGLSTIRFLRGQAVEAERLAARELAVYDRMLSAQAVDQGAAYKNRLRAKLLIARARAFSGEQISALRILDDLDSVEADALAADPTLHASWLRERGSLRVENGLVREGEADLRTAQVLLGPNPEVARLVPLLCALADAHRVKGEFREAELLATRALEQARASKGASKESELGALIAMTRLHIDRRDLGSAILTLADAAEISVPLFGETSPRLWELTFYLAQLVPDIEQKKVLLTKALALLDRAGLYDHPGSVGALGLLAMIDAFEGRRHEATERIGRGMAISRESNRRMAGVTLISAHVHRLLGDVDRAEAEYLQAYQQAIAEQGIDHHATVDAARYAGLIEWSRGEYGKASTILRHAFDASDRVADAVLATGTDADRVAYMGHLTFESDLLLNMIERKSSAELVGLAFETSVRRRGRALEIAAEQSRHARAAVTLEDKRLLEELSDAGRALAEHYFRAPDPARDSPSSWDLLSKRYSELQRQLSRGRMRGSSGLQSSTPRLGPGEVLLEFVSYGAVPSFRPWLEPGGRRYAAFVVDEGGAPEWVPLGEAIALESALAECVERLSHPASTGYREKCNQAFRRLLGPLQDRLAGKKTVFVVPDGAVHLVPVGALVTDDGRYLAEELTIQYLSTARELGSRVNASAVPTDLLVLANPDFGAGAHDKAEELPFASLPGTHSEAATIGMLFAGASVLEGKDASESRLKSARAPMVLHIASHAFFAARRSPGAVEGESEAVSLIERVFQGVERTAATRAASLEILERSRLEPLLRSGVALAGANGTGDGAEDGILTALEAASLGLTGTRLVVVSGCEGAQGSVVRGEGVYGLRRAFAIAGAESQVLALWQVSDESTARLMRLFYEELAAGGSPGGSLRTAQLRLLRDERLGHPFFWAAFVYSGKP